MFKCMLFWKIAVFIRITIVPKTEIIRTTKFENHFYMVSERQE